MKKIFTLTASVLLLLWFVLTADAKTDNAKATNKPVVTEKNQLKTEKNTLKTVTPAVSVKPAKDDENVKVAGEVAVVIAEQDAVDARAETALKKTEGRPAAIKLLIGPDYKNLGQLRSEIVHTENNIKKLKKLEEKASEIEKPAIETVISGLEKSATDLKTDMSSKLSGFSLLGWLFRWLNGFTPTSEGGLTPSVTVTVTVTPAVTGSLTVSPVATPGASLTPVVSVSPTTTVTPTPAATLTPTP